MDEAGGALMSPSPSLSRACMQPALVPMRSAPRRILKKHVSFSMQDEPLSSPSGATAHVAPEYGSTCFAASTVRVAALEAASSDSAGSSSAKQAPSAKKPSAKERLMASLRSSPGASLSRAGAQRRADAARGGTHRNLWQDKGRQGVRLAGDRLGTDGNAEMQEILTPSGRCDVRLTGGSLVRTRSLGAPSTRNCHVSGKSRSRKGSRASGSGILGSTLSDRIDEERELDDDLAQKLNTRVEELRAFAEGHSKSWQAKALNESKQQAQDGDKGKDAFESEQERGSVKWVQTGELLSRGSVKRGPGSGTLKPSRGFPGLTIECPTVSENEDEPPRPASASGSRGVPQRGMACSLKREGGSAQNEDAEDCWSASFSSFEGLRKVSGTQRAQFLKEITASNCATTGVISKTKNRGGLLSPRAGKGRPGSNNSEAKPEFTDGKSPKGIACRNPLASRLAGFLKSSSAAQTDTELPTRRQQQPQLGTKLYRAMSAAAPSFTKAIQGTLSETSSSGMDAASAMDAEAAEAKSASERSGAGGKSKVRKGRPPGKPTAPKTSSARQKPKQRPLATGRPRLASSPVKKSNGQQGNASSSSSTRKRASPRKVKVASPVRSELKPPSPRHSSPSATSPIAQIATSPRARIATSANAQVAYPTPLKAAMPLPAPSSTQRSSSVSTPRLRLKSCAEHKQPGADTLPPRSLTERAKAIARGDAEASYKRHSAAGYFAEAPIAAKPRPRTLSMTSAQSRGMEFYSDSEWKHSASSNGRFAPAARIDTREQEHFAPSETIDTRELELRSMQKLLLMGLISHEEMDAARMRHVEAAVPTVPGSATLGRAPMGVGVLPEIHWRVRDSGEGAGAGCESARLIRAETAGDAAAGQTAAILGRGVTRSRVFPSTLSESGVSEVEETRNCSADLNGSKADMHPISLQQGAGHVRRGLAQDEASPPSPDDPFSFPGSFKEASSGSGNGSQEESSPASSEEDHEARRWDHGVKGEGPSPLCDRTQSAEPITERGLDRNSSLPTPRSMKDRQPGLQLQPRPDLQRQPQPGLQRGVMKAHQPDLPAGTLRSVRGNDESCSGEGKEQLTSPSAASSVSAAESGARAHSGRRLARGALGFEGNRKSIERGIAAHGTLRMPRWRSGAEFQESSVVMEEMWRSVEPEFKAIPENSSSTLTTKPTSFKRMLGAISPRFTRDASVSWRDEGSAYDETPMSGPLERAGSSHGTFAHFHKWALAQTSSSGPLRLERRSRKSPYL